MELKQNNITGNYFSEEYLMNTVSRFWRNFVAEEFSYENAVATAYCNFGKCGLPELAERLVVRGGF